MLVHICLHYYNYTWHFNGFCGWLIIAVHSRSLWVATVSPHTVYCCCLIYLVFLPHFSCVGTTGNREAQLLASSNKHVVGELIPAFLPTDFPSISWTAIMDMEDFIIVMVFRPYPQTKVFLVFLDFWSEQATTDLTAGMPLSPGMCWSLHAATIHLSYPKHGWLDCRVRWRRPLSGPWGLTESTHSPASAGWVHTTSCKNMFLHSNTEHDAALYLMLFTRFAKWTYLTNKLLFQLSLILTLV